MRPHDIVIDAPGMNALSTDVMRWLRAQLARAAGAPVLITGRGKALSAGLDIPEVTDLDRDGLRSFLDLLEDMVLDFYTYPGPLVAWVNGHAIAGGCVIAMCCDARIAARDSRARMGLNEVAMGVPFPPRVMALVQDRVPRQHYERVVLGAELHPVDTALELGLLDALEDDPETAARERLALLAAHPPRAYAAAKCPRRRRALEIDEATRRRWEEEELPMWWSEPVRALMRARLAK